jgi:hypothetical protein
LNDEFVNTNDCCTPVCPTVTFNGIDGPALNDAPAHALDAPTSIVRQTSTADTDASRSLRFG